ncbi:peptidylprolyl isomerase [Candidatus Dependentiae bacterium]|nr:peptidylprolyl isomerase [Candidatus Dependentiae bacterium]
MTSAQQRMLKNKFAKAILWITFFSMAGGSLLFSPNLFKRFSGGAPAIGTVDHAAISVNQFRQKVVHEAERIELFKEQMGPQAEMMMRMMGINEDPRVLAVQSLIVETILNTVADALGIKISGDFLARKMQDPMFVVQELRDTVPFSVVDQRGQISMNLLRYYLQTHGITLSDFEQSIEEALRRVMVRDMICLSHYISNQDLKDAFIARYIPREYSMLTFKLDKYLKELRTKPLDQKEVEEFFAEQNSASKRYWSPEKRTAKVYEFKQDQFGLKVPDEAIEKYYSDHKPDYLESPVEVQVRRILVKLDEKLPNQALELMQKIKEELKLAPGNFAKLAKEHSQDAATASKGGLLGFFKKGEMHEALEKASFRLQNDGDISDIVKTDAGLELVQRVSRKPAVYKTLAMVKPEIVKLLTKQKFDEQFSRESRALTNQLRTKPEAIDAFVQKHHGAMRTAQVSRKDASLLSQRIFKNPLHEWTTFTGDDGIGSILETTAVEKSAEVPLETVRKQVEDDLYYDKARKAMKKALRDAQAKAKTASLASLKNEFGGSVELTGMVTPDDKEAIEALEAKHFPMSAISSLSKPGALHAADQGDSAYILKLESMKPFDEATFAQKKQELMAELSQQQKELAYRGYIASLYRNATINLTQDSNSQNDRLPLED